MTEPLTAADLDEAKRIAFEDPWWAGSNAARLVGKLIAEVERLTASDPYTAGLNDGIGQAHRRIAELKAQLADYESDRRRVYAEPCDLPPDEKHCSCVAPLREEIRRLTTRIAELEAQLAAARAEHDGAMREARDRLNERIDQECALRATIVDSESRGAADVKRRAIEKVHNMRTDGSLSDVVRELEAL